MGELKKDDVGSTGDGLGEGASAETKAGGRGAGGEMAKGSSAVSDNATASNKGTIATGGGDEDLTQASGGSVD